jgi:hypothetical protein
MTLTVTMSKMQRTNSKLKQWAVQTVAMIDKASDRVR